MADDLPPTEVGVRVLGFRWIGGGLSTLGQHRRHHRTQHAGDDAGGARGVVTAPREQRCGRRGAADHSDGPGRPHEPGQSGVVLRAPQPVQLVVDQRLCRAGPQRATEGPQDESGGEGDERRRHRPQRETRRGDQRTGDQQLPSGHAVGQHTGGDLDDHRRHRPDDEQRRDLGGSEPGARNPGVGEEDGVQRVERDEVFEEGGAHRRGCQPAVGPPGRCGSTSSTHVVNNTLGVRPRHERFSPATGSRPAESRRQYRRETRRLQQGRETKCPDPPSGVRDRSARRAT